MLFLHDAFAVMGEREFDFEDAVRGDYVDAIAADGDTRFLRYLRSVHGSAQGYYVVLLTAVRDGAALERLSERLRYGDLAPWAKHISSLRYQARSTLLVRPSWSATPDYDLAALPNGAADHPTAFFREDRLEGPGVHAALASAAGRVALVDGVLAFEEAFQPALDTDTTAHLLYRIPDADRLTAAWGTDAGWGDWSGSLLPTLPAGVRGSGRYLRSAPWSPLP